MFTPAFDGQVCSLGYGVVDFILDNTCHGPGDLQGQPSFVDDEMLDFIVDAYKIDPQTGRRLHDESILSRPKGRAKTEIAGWLVVAEAFGPVRFSHWDDDGQPVGKPVVSPLIKCLATEESQATAAFSVVAYIVNDWGKEHQPELYAGVSGARQYQSATALYLPHGGEVRACTAGSASKDGGKETFVVADEALALDTPLPTPTGWTTMGDVNVGDRLIGSDGLPVEVVKVTDIQDDRLCWRVSFADGTSMVASDGHRWMTRVNTSAALPRVRTTGEMVADGRSFRIPRAKVLKTPDVPLPIDPYVLGLWLGDGDKNNVTIAADPADAIEHIAEIERRGYTAKLTKTAPTRAALIYVSVPGSHRNRFSPAKGLKARLREQGLMGNKHIPVQYLRAGTEQRLDLLRGLMDSAGYVSLRGNCVFVQTDKELTEDVAELLRSLGQEPRLTWRADPRSRQGGVYKVSFTSTGIVPVRLPRKVERVREALRGEGWSTITGIEPVPSVPVRCVGVAAVDHLFVAGDGWKITHNTHLYVLRELKAMYGTVRRNLGKRKLAEPWMLQTTTAYRPGEQSIAEETLTAWRKGELSTAVHVDHREAKGKIDLDDVDHTMKQLRYVYGDAADWMDLARIYREMRDPRSCPDDATAARYFLNRAMATQDAWIALDVVERQARAEVVEPGTAVAMGFDGSINDDATVLFASRMSDGFIFPVGIWAKPSGPEGNWWEVPRTDVLATIREAFSRYTVSRCYMDPHEWRSDIDSLAEELGEERVIPWETRRDVQMAAALDRLRTDLVMDAVHHSGDPVMMEHFGNAYVRRKGGHRLVRKEHDQSNRKIDSVLGAALAYEARADAITAGWGVAKPKLVRARGRGVGY